jgi:poly(A) polymerase/tRNA nucleotidyltransferase (CCA-adding enzyme)
MVKMIITLPIEPLFILQTLKKAGYQGYIVGGAVRDLLRKSLDSTVSVTDYDLTTDATPEQISELFPESFYENQFGTVSITQNDTRAQAGLSEVNQEEKADNPQLISADIVSKAHASLSVTKVLSATKKTHEPVYEITTYRSDGAYADHRRPESVTWGETLEEDLERRDFTINAMAITVADTQLSTIFENISTEIQTVPIEASNYHIIDPHQGMQDLDWKIIRTVGNAHQRFQEDALRMLRAIRFSVQLGFSIDSEIMTAIKDHAELLQHVSGERIRDEFLKMLASQRPKQAIELLDQTNLLVQFLPELLSAKGVNQGGHHTTDVWTHLLDALETCPSSDPIVRLATLLHDIDKPATFASNESGEITFYNHEVVGARTAKQIAERLRLSKRDIERIFILVRYHMFYYQPEHTDAAIRRFMRKVGLENVNDMLDLREADRLGSGAKKTSWRLEEMKQRMIEQLNQPFDVTDLAVDGTDLMNELHIPAGPVIGKVLHSLLEEVLENPELNTKEILIQKAKQIITS